MLESQWVSIARILKPRGNRGEVAAEVLTDFPNRFEVLRDVTLQREEIPPQQRILDSHWFHKNQVILKFKGVDSISQAEELRGFELKVPREATVALPAGTYYYFDLVGCTVKDREGRILGQVVEVLDLGGGHLLRVAEDQREFLMPFAQNLLVRVDLENKELICDPPEGLLDL